MSSPIEKFSFSNFSIEIKEFNDQFRDPINVFEQNLKNFQERIEDAKANLLKEPSTQQNIKDKILQAFDANIGETITDLLAFFSDKLTTTDHNFLVNVYFAKKIIKVLQGIFEFEKKIGEILPNNSEKIIKIFGNCIINLFIIQFPVIGILIKTANIIDKIYDCVAKKNADLKIIEWQEQIKNIEEIIQELKNNKTLGQDLKVAKQIEILGNYSDLNLTDIANLGLKSDAIGKVYELVKINIKEKDSLVLIVNSFKQIPKNNQEIQQKLREIKIGIVEIIADLQATIPEIKVLHEKVNKHLAEASKDLTSMLGYEKSFIEKLSLCQKAINNISAIINETKKTVQKSAAGTIIINKLEYFISKKVIKFFLPTSLLMLKAHSPIMFEILGITNALRVKFTSSLSKAASVSQGRAL